MEAAARAETAETLVLIDLSALFWSAWHATADQAVSSAVQTTVNGVRRIVAKYPRAAICCDSGRSWRKDLYEGYKAQRPEKDHASLGELDRVQARLRADGFLLWAAPGMEADDIIATAVMHATRDERIGHVVIASADKDLLQLVCSNVTAWSTKTWLELGSKEVREKFGVSPGQMGAWLALVGDASDNIPGVKGVGPKTAAALLNEFGDLGGIYRAALDLDSSITPKVREALIAAEAEVGLARKLIALRTDAPIDFGQVFEHRAEEPIATQEDATVNDLNSGAPANDVDVDPDEPEPAPAPQKAPTQPEVIPRQAAPTAPVTALQVVPPQPYERGLEPMSPGAAYKMAVGLYNSRLYSRFANPEAIWAVIIRGREMGLGALTALDCFQVIEGKPAPSAHLIIARTKDHPDCEYFQCIETTATSSTWETKHRRNPKPTRLTYTLEDARTAGLLAPPAPGKREGNWLKRPTEMLRKTAAVQLARMEYPGAALGLYSAEELGGDIE